MPFRLEPPSAQLIVRPDPHPSGKPCTFVEAMKLEHVLVLSLFVGALGHGALTKPLPRLVSGQQYCPWCVGEHQPVTNPSGVVNRDAEPSSPCLGSQIGDAPYPASNYNNYRVCHGSGRAFLHGRWQAGSQHCARC